ncbi:MAG: peptidoglycan DD-metalloendopeptidase family protein [Alteromonadaceae bacterium]|nr:peptidoglycan DD-metalloendopeptidase family protein [Alteromonadaceae bacterium]
MRKYLLLIILAFLSFVSLAAEPVLMGEMTQGSLIRGKVAPGTKGWLNERRLTVSKGGHFAFGFGRDDDLQHTLKWQLPEQELQQKVLTLSKREYKIQRIDGLPQKMVTPPKEVLEKISADAKQVREARALRADSVDFIENFIWPAQGPISGVYGSQRVLNGEKKRPHFGIDVAAPIGEPVYAPASGVITLFVADMYYSGGTMIIDHGHGISSTFLHLHKSHVKVGDIVEQGQLVAEIGDTGRVTGPHLDWRMNWHEKRVDPGLLVPSRE